MTKASIFAKVWNVKLMLKVTNERKKTQQTKAQCYVKLHPRNTHMQASELPLSAYTVIPSTFSFEG